MLIQKLPNEEINNALVGDDLDTLIVRIDVPANWSNQMSFTARYQGYDQSYVESIGESALIVGANQPTDKVVFTYESPSHGIRFTEGTHYIKIYKMSGFNSIDLTLRLPMYLVFGNPKYIYRTCTSRIGIGNIIKDGLPFDAVNYKMVDRGSTIASTGSFYMYGCKCSDFGTIVGNLYGAGSIPWYLGQGSDITGNIVCMDGRDGQKFYCSNTKLNGDIVNLGSMVSLVGSTTGDPAIYAQNTGISGDFDALANALFTNGKHSGTIMAQLAGSAVEYQGTVINGNASITFTEDGYSITIL